MAPIFAQKLFPRFHAPVDFDAKLDNKPLLGPHKTWRGLLAGIVVGLLVAGLQRLLLPSLTWLSIYDYSQWYLLGALLGLGAGLGDIAKSFFKRRIGIASGKPWVPFDQIDHPIGALLLASPIFFPGWTESLLIVLITFVGHIVITLFGYIVGLKTVPW